MQIFFYFLFLSILAILEPSFGFFPLTLLFLILVTIFQKKAIIFFYALLGGLIVDSVSFRAIGISSFFFLLTVGLIFLYSRKFETKHVFFVVAVTSVSGIFYELFFSTTSLTIFWQILFLDVVAAGLFYLLIFFQNKLNQISH